MHISENMYNNYSDNTPKHLTLFDVNSKHVYSIVLETHDYLDYLFVVLLFYYFSGSHFLDFCMLLTTIYNVFHFALT